MKTGIHRRGRGPLSSEDWHPPCMSGMTGDEYQIDYQPTMYPSTSPTARSVGGKQMQRSWQRIQSTCN